MFFKKYKNLWYSSFKGKEIEVIEGVIYYRYMDKIYIPNNIKDLSIEDTKALSEIRVFLDQEVIDYSYSKEVNSYLFSKIKKENKKTIVDFGCGAGFLLNCLAEEEDIINYYGLDFTLKSLEIGKLNYSDFKNFNVFFNKFEKKDRIDLKSESVDSILSCFVMHFNIFDDQLIELYRVLKKEGQFIYNDFYFDKKPNQTKNIIKKLKKIGFDIKIEIKTFNQENKEKQHKIVIATKK